MRHVLATLLLCSSAAAQVDLWVDPVTGSDQGPGTSPGAPLRTITRALQLTGPGSTVFLFPGDYSTASGEMQPWVLGPNRSIEALEGPDRTMLSGSTLDVFLRMGSGSQLSGVSLRTFGSNMLSTTSQFLQAPALLHDCHFLGGSIAILRSDIHATSCRFDSQFNAAVVGGQNGGTFIDCEFVGAPGPYGIHHFQSGSSATTPEIHVQRCSFSGFGRAGIWMELRSHGGHTSLSVLDCLFTNNAGAGVRVQLDPVSGQPYTVEIEGTTIAGSGEYGVYHTFQSVQGGLSLRSSVIAGSGISDFRGNGSSSYSLVEDGSGPPGVSNLVGDPGFVDAAGGDWGLRFDSQCLDQGDPTLARSDFLGRPRTVDSDLNLAPRADMGAIEHRPLSGPPSAAVGQPFEVGVTGPDGGFSTVIVAPGGYATSGAVTAFGRFFLEPQGSFRVLPVATTGAGPTYVDLATHLDSAWIGTSIGIQALPRSLASPSGAAFSNPLLVTIE